MPRRAKPERVHTQYTFCFSKRRVRLWARDYRDASRYRLRYKETFAVAIEFARVDIVKAGEGGGAVCLSAYIEREAKRNEITGDRYHWGHLEGVPVHNEVMLPEGAPEAFRDSTALWTAAERADLVRDGTRFRSGAQLAKHMVLALPKELTDDERQDLARRFVAEKFVSNGVPAQLVIHTPHQLKEGQENHHAHVLVSTRTLEADGFGKKARELNPRFVGGAIVEKDYWNRQWRDFQNRYFIEHGMDLRVDPSGVVAGVHLGPARYQKQAERVAEAEAAEAANRAAVRSNPAIVLERLTDQAATFTRADIARALHRHFDGAAEFQAALATVEASPDLVRLIAKDESGDRRFTTREMVGVEARAIGAAERLSGAESHAISPVIRDQAITAFEARKGFSLTDEQRKAVGHLTDRGAAKAVLGFAGAGKSTMLDAAKGAWEASGLRVVGGTLSGIAAENLQENGIESRTLASWEFQLRQRDEIAAFRASYRITDGIRQAMNASLDQWEGKAASQTERATIERLRAQVRTGFLREEGRHWADAWAERQLERKPRIDEKTVFVLDEAGMVGARQFERLLARIEKAGAKIVMVGDYRQLQPIEAGAAFRVIAEKIGFNALTEINRQRADWMRAATKQMATLDIRGGLNAYAERGKVKAGIAADYAATLRMARHVAAEMSPADERRVENIARYLESKRGAGVAWRALQAEGGEKLRDHFIKTQTARNLAAVAIARDLEGCKPWLARMGVSGEALAADIAVAKGTHARASAQAARKKLAEEAGLKGIEKAAAPAERFAADHRAGAKAALIADWQEARAAAPEKRRIILTYTNADTEDLNRRARMVLRQAGALAGEDIRVATKNGARDFAAGDRIVFLDNDKGLGVKNGTLATVREIAGHAGAARFSVVLDDGRAVSFSSADYKAFDHGNALTVHKSQGVTVDETYMLATGQTDAHLSYVGMSRHRDELRVYAATADAPTAEILGAVLTPARTQDSTMDYEREVDLPKQTPTLAPKAEHGERQVAERVNPTSRAPHLGAETERPGAASGKPGPAKPAGDVPTATGPDPLTAYTQTRELLKKASGEVGIKPDAHERVNNLLRELRQHATAIAADPAMIEKARQAGLERQVAETLKRSHLTLGADSALKLRH